MENVTISRAMPRHGKVDGLFGGGRLVAITPAGERVVVHRTKYGPWGQAVIGHE